MAYYVLAEGFELCGWKGLPFGLRYPNPMLTDFFDKEAYRVVYAFHDEKEKKCLPRRCPKANWRRSQAAVFLISRTDV